MEKALGLIFGMLLFGCAPQKDYYSLFMKHGCQPEEKELTADYERAIRSPRLSTSEGKQFYKFSY